MLLIMAQALGGAALLIGVFVTWRRITATERNVEIAQEGQITERFTRAIEQLGSDKLQVRLGGIYALERIARDSERDHWPIMEVLTAYVRENWPWKEGQASEEESPRRVAAELQAILTVIGRRQRTFGKGEDERLNLISTDLRGANLRDAHLEGADLTEARLEEANLDGAHLERARFFEAHLEGADLTGAHQEGADLIGAHQERAGLGGAHQERARLTQAHLEGAYLFEAHLEEAVLYGAHLEGAVLEGARLEEANLMGAHLEKAYLTGAHLEGANLTGAHLEKAYLTGAHLEGADLIGAHLEGADLRLADGLTQAQIDPAHTDEDTQLPDYLKPSTEGEQQSG